MSPTFCIQLGGAYVRVLGHVRVPGKVRYWLLASARQASVVKTDVPNIPSFPALPSIPTALLSSTPQPYTSAANIVHHIFQISISPGSTSAMQRPEPQHPWQ